MKKLSKPVPPVYTGFYKNIGYSLTSAGLWVFNYPSPIGGIHWERFFTNEEQDLLDVQSKLTMIEQEAIIKRGIDRAFRQEIMYTGDLRFRR